MVLYNEGFGVEVIGWVYKVLEIPRIGEGGEGIGSESSRKIEVWNWRWISDIGIVQSIRSPDYQKSQLPLNGTKYSTQIFVSRYPSHSHSTSSVFKPINYFKYHHISIIILSRLQIHHSPFYSPTHTIIPTIIPIILIIPTSSSQQLCNKEGKGREKRE